MQKYNKYHTNVKVCYSLGIEKQLLPKDFIQTIPTSTVDYWKKTKPEDCLGIEYSNVVNKSIEDLHIMCDDQVALM